MPTPVLLLSSDEQAVHVVSQVLTELGLVSPSHVPRSILELGSDRTVDQIKRGSAQTARDG